MITIDTNVLLRYLLWDDDKQAKKADALINNTQLVLITDVVLVETLWTLKGKKYKLDKTKIIDIVDALFTEKNICFENAQVIWQTLNDFRQAKSVKDNSKNKHVDFADVLIVNKAKYYASQHKRNLVGVYTFDKAALVIKGTKSP